MLRNFRAKFAFKNKISVLTVILSECQACRALASKLRIRESLKRVEASCGLQVEQLFLEGTEQSRLRKG